MTYARTTVTIDGQRWATGPPSSAVPGASATPLPRQRMPRVGSPSAATESRRVNEPLHEPLQQQPAPLATVQGPFLPGVEPFRWLREYPPGMFDGLLRRRTSRR